MKDTSKEALRWLTQAENDLQYAKIGFREGFYAQVCFQAQQVCEKALKSIHYGHLQKRIVYGHSLVELSKELNLDTPSIDDLAILDQYYIPTRYPNGLPGSVPYEVYTEKQAHHGLVVCEETIAQARNMLPLEK